MQITVVDFNLQIPSNLLLCAALLAFLLGTAGASTGPAGSRARRGASGLVWVLPAVAISTTAALATPWNERRPDSASLIRAEGGLAIGLRRRSLGADLTTHLRRRPADAPAWVALGWLCLPQPSVAPLAAWGVSLDPPHDALRRAAERLSLDAQAAPQGTAVARFGPPVALAPRRHTALASRADVAGGVGSVAVFRPESSAP